jgi:hypothetical protein
LTPGLYKEADFCTTNNEENRKAFLAQYLFYDPGFHMRLENGSYGTRSVKRNERRNPEERLKYILFDTAGRWKELSGASAYSHKLYSGKEARKKTEASKK